MSQTDAGSSKLVTYNQTHTISSHAFLIVKRCNMWQLDRACTNPPPPPHPKSHIASSSHVNHFSLQFWLYYINWANTITTPCKCVSNTAYNQPKAIQEPEIWSPRDTKQQWRVVWVAGSMPEFGIRKGVGSDICLKTDSKNVFVDFHNFLQKA